MVRTVRTVTGEMYSTQYLQMDRIVSKTNVARTNIAWENIARTNIAGTNIAWENIARTNIAWDKYCQEKLQWNLL